MSWKRNFIIENYKLQLHTLTKNVKQNLLLFFYLKYSKQAIPTIYNDKTIITRRLF